MYTLTTTLNRIRACSPCKDGWSTLLRSMPDMDHDTEFNILRVLDSNGVQDMLWCLRATEGKSAIVALAVAFAESVLYVFESVKPGDNRPRLAIEAAKAYLADPSRDAADAAARAAADAAARAAGYTSYADAAARAADAAANAQIEIILSILE